MDVLGDYGSDSDASSTNEVAAAAPKDASAAKSSTTAATTLLSLQQRLPTPAYNGPSGWIHGHENHLSGTSNSISSGLSAASSGAKLALKESSAPTLAQELRSQKEFGNPKHLERTVESLGIVDLFGSNISDSFEDWELTQLLEMEEKAREQQQTTTAVATVPGMGVSASDFVQDQISRAMGHGRRYHP